jgi:hypothetical protein
MKAAERFLGYKEREERPDKNQLYQLQLVFEIFAYSMLTISI